MSVTPDEAPLTERLKRACVASCTCNTMTPDIQHHDAMCHYRLFVEAASVIETYERPRSRTQEAGTEEDRHLRFTIGHYSRTKLRDLASVRSGHGDAAHMCDAIAADIRAEHTKRGRVTNMGEAMASAVKRAGDAIWSMREKVE